MRAIEKQFEYNGHKYWVILEPAINTISGAGGFIAYVNDEKPGAIFYGASVKDPQGRAMFFRDEFTAFANANAVKQSELKTPKKK
jgi:hypothetical protein